MVAELTVLRLMVDAALPLPMTTRSEEAVVVALLDVFDFDDDFDDAADEVTAAEVLDGELAGDALLSLADDVEASEDCDVAAAEVDTLASLVDAAAVELDWLDGVSVGDEIEAADEESGADDEESGAVDEDSDAVVGAADVLGNALVVASDVLGDTSLLVEAAAVDEGVELSAGVLVDAAESDAEVEAAAEDDWADVSALVDAPVLRLGEFCLFGIMPRRSRCGGIGFEAVTSAMTRKMANARSVSRDDFIILNVPSSLSLSIDEMNGRQQPGC